MTVDADKLSARYGAVHIRPNSESGVPVTLRVHLSGRMRYGLIDTR